VNWTRDQVLAALHLYFQLPFGQLHQHQPRIQALAAWLGRTPSAVAMKLSNLASLDPQIIASGRAGLKGASRLDHELWQALQADWDAVAMQAAAAFEHAAAQHGLSAEAAEGFSAVDIDEPAANAFPSAAATDRVAMVRLRLNQARFRRAVLASYGGRCCMSGLAEPLLLVASHIRPWATDSHNRLNPRNGLCLSALHDRAFDRGLITVAPGIHTVQVHPAWRDRADSSALARTLLTLEGSTIRMPERFAPDDDFLAWHGQHFQFKPTAANAR
jgi:putative restriction endonuclease